MIGRFLKAYVGLSAKLSPSSSLTGKVVGEHRDCGGEAVCVDHVGRGVKIECQRCGDLHVAPEEEVLG